MKKEPETSPRFGDQGAEYEALEIEGNADPEAEHVFQDTMRRIELLDNPNPILPLGLQFTAEAEVTRAADKTEETQET